MANIYKTLKPFWILNSVSFARVIACFPQVSLSLLASTVADWETPCVCACQSDQPKLCLPVRVAPKAWLLIWSFKPLITFWNSIQRDYWCQIWANWSKVSNAHAPHCQGLVTCTHGWRNRAWFLHGGRKCIQNEILERRAGLVLSDSLSIPTGGQKNGKKIELKRG